MTQLLLAWRLLLRRPFFTFVSLFGISFTIMTLVAIAALVDAAAGAHAPLGYRDRLVFANTMTAEDFVPDTTYTVDSVRLADGALRYDSTRHLGERRAGMSVGGLDPAFVDQRLRALPGVREVAVTNPTVHFDAYLASGKVPLDANYTDAAYWRVFDFEFVQGRPYTAEEVAAGTPSVVLGERAARDFFGTAGADVIGRPLPVADAVYTVVGVVAHPSQGFLGLDADLFLPYTLGLGPEQGRAPGHSFDDYGGRFRAIFRVDEPSARAPLIAALGALAAALQPLYPPGTDDESTGATRERRYTLQGLTFAQQLASDLVPQAYEDRARALGRALPGVLALLLALIALPALNLVDVNLGRVFERAPEIAVRKSFGASDGDILRQFLVESVVVTTLGGVLGVALAAGLLALVNAQRWIGEVELRFTPAVALAAIAIILGFSLLTGLAPAYRMARTPVAASLR